MAKADRFWSPRHHAIRSLQPRAFDRQRKIDKAHHTYIESSVSTALVCACEAAALPQFILVKLHSAGATKMVHSAMATALCEAGTALATKKPTVFCP